MGIVGVVGLGVSLYHRSGRHSNCISIITKGLVAYQLDFLYYIFQVAFNLSRLVRLLNRLSIAFASFMLHQPRNKSCVTVGLRLS